MSSLRLSCLAARSLPIGLRVVDGEHGVDLGEAGQVALHDVQAALARALAVLVVGQDLDVRVLGQHLLAAVDAVDHGADLRAVLDDHVAACLAELVGDELAGDLAGLDIVGLHGGVGAGGRDVDATTTMPAACARLIAGAMALGSAALTRIMSTPGGDEVVDLGELLVQVVVGRGGVDLDVRVDLLGLGLGALATGRRRTGCPASRAVMPIALRSLAEAGPLRERQRGAGEQQCFSMRRTSLVMRVATRRRTSVPPIGLAPARRVGPVAGAASIRSGRCPAGDSGRARRRR